MGSQRQSPPGGTYTKFGWQGINLTVPSGWDLVFARGDRRSGSIRLADTDAVRMEVRWKTGGADVPPADTVDVHVEKLQRAARKSGASLSVRRGLNIASPVGKEVECYRWRDTRQYLAMLSRCRHCGRSVHLHLVGGTGDSLRGLARTVFSSLADHADGDTDLWSFFDVEFRAPADLPLMGKSLQSGCVRMRFSRGLMKLEFVRVSLAETLLAGKTMEDWFRGFYEKALKRRSFSIREAPVRTHPGILVEGRPWLLCNPLRVLGRARALRAACWQCEATNRLLICSFDGPDREASAFEPAVDGFRCCDDGEAA